MKRAAKWIDRNGNNLSSAAVAARINNAAGSKYTVASLCAAYRIGAIYRNGGIWFQRVG